MPSFITMSASNRNGSTRPCVNVGSWLMTARSANPAARMIVKMDKDAPYGVMADMMVALQEAKAPRFNVETDLEGNGGLFKKSPGGAK